MASIAIDSTDMIVNATFAGLTGPMLLDLDGDDKTDLTMDENGIHRLDGSTPPECAIVETAPGWVYNTACLRLPGAISSYGGTPYEMKITVNGTFIESGDTYCPEAPYGPCARPATVVIEGVTIPSPD